MGMEDFEFVNQYQIYSPECPSLDELTAVPQYSVTSIKDTLQHQQSNSSNESRNSNPTSCPNKRNIDSTPSTINEIFKFLERPTKQVCRTTSTTEEQNVSPQSIFSHLISFENSDSKPATIPHLFREILDLSMETTKVESKLPQEAINLYGASYNDKKKACRSPSYAQDHVNAERKRREKLNERFIALSALVPGLKKLDKASVIGDAIKYLKQLEEQVKLLEEQAKTKSEESVTFRNKSRILTEDDSTSSGEESAGRFAEGMPEIQARVSDKNVLIRIHCEKQNGLLVKLLSKLQELQLSVVNSSVLPFGNFAVDITIVAQMDAEFSMTVKDLVSKLRLDLQ